MLESTANALTKDSGSIRAVDDGAAVRPSHLPDRSRGFNPVRRDCTN
jgi:hypothetical protein